MAAAARNVSGLAERYAAALFDLADERKALDTVATDLDTLRAMLRESLDLRRLVRSPVLTREAQGKGDCGAGAGGAARGAHRQFPRASRAEPPAFRAAGDDRGLSRVSSPTRRGEVTAHVTAPQALSPAQRQAVTEQLRKAVGRKVVVDIEIDPSLLGRPCRQGRVAHGRCIAQEQAPSPASW